VRSAGRKPLHLIKQSPVDALQLGRERPLRRFVEPIPKGQEMLLTSTIKYGDDGRWGSHPRTHLQSIMHRRGKPTKITV